MDKIGSAGGKISAIISKYKSIEKYYSNPNYCLYCGKLIDIHDGMKVHDIKKKRFCDNSCAAFYNNKLRPPRHSTKTTSGNCKSCGAIILFKNRTNNNGYYTKRKYCDACAKINRIKNRGDNLFTNITKGELFNNRKQQWQSARSSIQKDARIKYLNSNKQLICFICGYNKHVDIAHIKSVSKFPNETLISTINDPSNLLALCPNHHWEYDHKLINIKI